MLNQDIVREATRLTRAGQLVEATALLQRMLRGESAPDATSRTTGRLALTGREPPIIDAKANTIEETDGAQLARTATAQPRMLGALLDRKKERSGLGLRGLIKRAPSTADIVPEGAKFIEGTYSNPAGSRAYRLFIPSRYQGQPLPLVVMLHGCTQSPDDFAAGTRMNFIAEEQPALWSIPHSAARQTSRNAGTGSVQPTSSGAEANLRLSRASLAKSCATIRLIQSASMSADCRPERPLRLSWEQPTTICMQRSGSIPASPAGPPLICPPHLPPCGKVADPVAGSFRTAGHLSRPLFFTATAT